MKTLVLSSTDLCQLADYNELCECMARALMSVSNNRAVSFPRIAVSIAGQKALGFMPALDKTGGILGYKAASVFYDNGSAGLNPHQGVVVLLDENTGLVKCLLEASTVTALRTAAASACATARLSREDSARMALIGAGRQALEHGRAIARIRKIDEITIYSRTTTNSEALAEKLRADHDLVVSVCDTAESAVREADIIVTCTSSRHALFDLDAVSEGAHINAVGACRPGYKEINLFSHPQLKIYLDSRASCALEADEIIQPCKDNTLAPENILGEMGECLLGIIPGRSDDRDITLFKSVGLGIEDIISAEYFYMKALSARLGQAVDFHE